MYKKLMSCFISFLLSTGLIFGLCSLQHYLLHTWYDGFVKLVIYAIKSTLERVSNPMYCCISALRHGFAMNII